MLILVAHENLPHEVVKPWLTLYLLNFSYKTEQGKSEGSDRCDRPSILTQIELKYLFTPVWSWNHMDEFEKQ